ncbi:MULTISPECIES: ABC transporter ATP-binding protein [unclassified Psychrobacter]|uniref:ABC transporter ATP-binding protein n=1 Tax=unclassified Psychrobacter TaxID=196806 RepID=UPI0025B5814D|nr:MULTISPECIES: ABC transporter ATP-binding protein [unclassified Psychrobacter]MDN3453273.1 ABC transporter ATP-binding protein [Psychrobacter sp. APC 3350]MDN3503231.1 ABC transporter ATP-binding protein [Psychrobacter sp. 5A.1]
MYTDSMNDSTDPKSVKTQANHTPVKKSPISQAQINPVQPNKTVEQRAASQRDSEKSIATDPYFSVQNLIVGYDDTIVVNGLSLMLEQGEIGCFLGYSGCGKTTALRAIAGLEQSRGGTIHLNNQRLTEKTARQSFAVAPAKRGMGMVFQDYALFGHLSVAKNIAFGLNKWSSADKKARVKEMLSLVELTEHADKRPNELSGGQQQRVALARALAPKPKLLLLDEPFSNLDVVLRESLAMNVRDILKRTNTTAILVTHDQNEAFALADKVGVMDKGRLVQWARPSELYHEPVSPFVAEFVGEGAMIDGIIKEGHVETALGDIYRRMEVYDESGQPQYCEYDYPNGTPIKVLVRPDDIIHDDDSTQTALVIGRVFRGANYLYRLQLDDGQTVLSLVASHHNHEIGSHIGILPLLEHVVVFDEKEINATTWSEYDRSSRSDEEI